MESSGRQAAVRQGTQPGVLQLVKEARLHKRPRLLALLSLWAFGLLSMFTLPAPQTITQEAFQRFEDKLHQADQYAPQRNAAQHKVMEAQFAVADGKEWFWWLSSDKRATVRQLKARESAASKELAVLDKRRAALLSDAKAELGVWSEVGVDEGRKLFWRSFEQGKIFGRQQTFWDAMLALLSGQDRNLAGAVIQLICSAVINFTIGMFVSVFVFVFQLPSLLMSYQAGVFSALGFAVVALVGALSVIAGFVTLLWGAGAGAMYTVATLAGPVRIGPGPQQRRYAMHYHTE